VLAGLAGLAAGASGCLQRARSVVDRSGPRPISLSIKTVPTDSDPRAILIARFLAEKLDAVGIDATVAPMRPEEFLRDVLVNRRFEVYVGRHPGHHDPDFLRPLLHSRFDSEPGWQNPFGYANLQVDDLLVAQRLEAGRPRTETLRTLQRTVATDCPFAVVAFPDDIRAVRTDRYKYVRSFWQLPKVYLSTDVFASEAGREVRERYAVPTRPYEELYDLRETPQEDENVVHEPRYQEVRLDLARQLRGWMERTDDPLLEGPVLPPDFEAIRRWPQELTP
jgi:peptide/nickel transport system substrate-binding protein